MWCSNYGVLRTLPGTCRLWPSGPRSGLALSSCPFLTPLILPTCFHSSTQLIPTISHFNCNCGRRHSAIPTISHFNCNCSHRHQAARLIFRLTPRTSILKNGLQELVFKSPYIRRYRCLLCSLERQYPRAYRLGRWCKRVIGPSGLDQSPRVAMCLIPLGEITLLLQL